MNIFKSAALIAVLVSLGACTSADRFGELSSEVDSFVLAWTLEDKSDIYVWSIPVAEFTRRIQQASVTPNLSSNRYSFNVRAEERGVGIFEMAPSKVWQDLEQWEPLLKWLRSKRSKTA